MRYLVDDVMGFYEMGDISPYKMGNIFPYEMNKFLSVLLTEMKNWPGLPRTLWGGPPARFFFRLESVACKSLKLIPFTSGVPGTAQIKVQLTQALLWS